MTLTSGTTGYISFATKPFQTGVRFNGRHFQTRSGVNFIADLTAGGMSRSRGSMLYTLRTTLGLVITQTRFRGGDAPMGMRAASISMPIYFELEEDFYAVQAAEAMERPVQIFWGAWPTTDAWWLPGRNAGMNHVRTSRPLAYDGARITHSTAPCRAFLDGVELTVVTGTPGSASEIKVPAVASGDTNDVITTHADLAGTQLVLRYPSAAYHEIKSVTEALETMNGFRTEISCEEKLCGSFTLGTVS